jgi:hypothetical protein
LRPGKRADGRHSDEEDSHHKKESPHRRCSCDRFSYKPWRLILAQELLCNGEKSLLKSETAFGRAVQKIVSKINSDGNPAGVASKINSLRTKPRSVRVLGYQRLTRFQNPRLSDWKPAPAAHAEHVRRGDQRAFRNLGGFGGGLDRSAPGGLIDTALVSVAAKWSALSNPAWSPAKAPPAGADWLHVKLRAQSLCAPPTGESECEQNCAVPADTIRLISVLKAGADVAKEVKPVIQIVDGTQP